MVGKLLGAMVGLYRGGPFGLLLGLVVGHGIDHWLQRRVRANSPAPPAQVHSRYFEATFQFMGHMAKTKGRVEEADIEFARAVMARIGLSTMQRERAVALYNVGKSTDFDRNTELEALARWLAPHTSLVMLFMETLVQAAYASGPLTATERLLLQRLCDVLSVNRIQFEYIHRRVLAQRAWQAQQRQQGQGGGMTGLSLQEAYDVLGVKPNADDKTVKTAYRRLMSQHHPDKMMAQGLPDSMLKLAKEKVQTIQAAYSAISKHRKSTRAQ